MMEHLSDRISRRGVLNVGLGLIGAGSAWAGDGQIISVSRERLLREVAVARAVRASEVAATARLQALVDEATARFAAEEQALAEKRSELSKVEFRTQAADFDRRIRAARKIAQERAALLQRSYQEVRARIVSLIPRVLEDLRKEHGAEVILNADQILAARAGVDATSEAIAMFDEMAPDIALPNLNLWDPIVPELENLPAGDDTGQSQ